MTHKLRTLIAGLCIGAGLSGYLFYEPVQALYAQVPSCTEPLVQPTILAHAGFVADVETGEVLFDKNGDAQLPLASLTKLMTVDTAREILAHKTVTVTDAALKVEGESGFTRGEVWDAVDLAHFTLIESSNDGAQALADAAEVQLGLNAGGFVDQMNRRARALGLTQTFFLSPTGLDLSSTSASAFGSARDVATLLAAMAVTAPDTLERSPLPTYRFVSKSGTVHTAKNTTLLASLYGAAIASKTGYTDLAGGNLAFMFEALPGHPVVLAVLGSTREAREADTEVLADFAIRSLRRNVTCHTVW